MWISFQNNVALEFIILLFKFWVESWNRSTVWTGLYLLVNYNKNVVTFTVTVLWSLREDRSYREHVQENAGVHWRRLHACPREHPPVPAALRRDPVLHRLRGGKNGRVQFPQILPNSPTDPTFPGCALSRRWDGPGRGAGRGRPAGQPASQPASQPTAYRALATRGQGEKSLKGSPPERTSKSTFNPQYGNVKQINTSSLCSDSL